MAPLPSQKFEVSVAQGGFIAEEVRSFCKAEFTCTGLWLLIGDPEPNPKAKPQREGPFKHLRQTLAPVVHVVSSCGVQKSTNSH